MRTCQQWMPPLKVLWQQVGDRIDRKLLEKYFKAAQYMSEGP